MSGQMRNAINLWSPTIITMLVIFMFSKPLSGVANQHCGLAEVPFSEENINAPSVGGNDGEKVFASDVEKGQRKSMSFLQAKEVHQQSGEDVMSFNIYILNDWVLLNFEQEPAQTPVQVSVESIVFELIPVGGKVYAYQDADDLMSWSGEIIFADGFTFSATDVKVAPMINNVGFPADNMATVRWGIEGLRFIEAENDFSAMPTPAGILFLFEEDISNNKPFSLPIRVAMGKDTLDLSFFELTKDTKRPKVSKVTVYSQNSLAVIFSEAIDLASLSDLGNYQIEGRSIDVVEVERLTKVYLHTENPIPAEEPYALVIQNLLDLQGNKMSKSTTNFSYDPIPPQLLGVNYMNKDSVHLVFSEPITQANIVSATNQIFSMYRNVVATAFTNEKLIYQVADNAGNTSIQTVYRQNPEFTGGYFTDAHRIYFDGLPPSDFSPFELVIAPSGGGFWLVNEQPWSNGEMVQIQSNTDPMYHFEYKSGIDTVIRPENGVISVFFSQAVRKKGQYSVNDQLPLLEIWNEAQDKLDLLLPSALQHADTLKLAFSEMCAADGFPLPDFQTHLFTDLQPPALDSLWWEDARTIAFQFTETMTDNPVSDQMVKISNCTLLDAEWADRTLFVHLEPHSEDADSLDITLSSLEDLSGNRIAPMMLSLPPALYFQEFDLIMTEVLPQPDAGQEEFVEVYNMTDKAIPLWFFRLSDTNSGVDLPSVWLSPHAFFAINDLGGVSLNNEQDQLKISLGEQVIHQLEYQGDWFEGLEQKGYSLEMSQLRYPCKQAGNWRRSAVHGGTPASANSISDRTLDDTAPNLIQVYAKGNIIEMDFDEPVASFSWELDQAVEVISEQFRGQSYQAVLKQPLEEGRHYRLIIDALTDCIGNRKPVSYFFETARTPVAGALWVNELLFNPVSGGVDFIELKNKSAFSLDIKGLQLWRQEDVFRFPDELKLLPANGLVVLTADRYQLLQTHPEAQEALVYEMSMPPLADDKGDFSLGRADTVILDQVAYSHQYHHALLNNKEGVALERIEAAGTGASGWRSVSENKNFATPTRDHYADGANLVHQFGLSSNVLHVGGGNQDAANWVVDTQGENWLLTIKVYDFFGQLVRTIAEHELISNKATYSWSGLNNESVLVDQGHYLFWVSIVNQQNELYVEKDKIAVIHH